MVNNLTFNSRPSPPPWGELEEAHKSVLILCDLFPPAFAPRMGYLCKYLKINGWHPVVITEDVDENIYSFLCKDIDATRIRFYKKSGWAGNIAWGWTFLRDILFGYKDKRFYREALQKVKKQRFDLILCSTYRTFPMKAAWWLSRRTGLPLVVDLRDIIEQYTGNEFIKHPLPKLFGMDKLISFVFRKRNLKTRNKILRESACVTTISPWHVSILSAYNKHTKLIYNGYDPEIFYPVNKKTNYFFITYTGRLLSTAMRDPDLLFQAVEKLSNDPVITPDLLRIRWFVDEKSRQIIEKEAVKYPNVPTFMDYSGYIPASEIPEVLHESEILLVLTNKSDANGPKGIMTTKFFEFLAVGKPILCVRGDEGCLEEVIHRTRSGLSAHHATEVYDFIKTHYLRWKSNLPYEDPSDKTEIKKFSRESQAQQFINIFNKLLTKTL